MNTPARARLVALIAASAALVPITVGAGATPVAATPVSMSTTATTTCPTRAPSPPTPQTALPSTQLIGPAAIGKFFVSGQTLMVVGDDSKTLVSINTSDLTTTSEPINAPDVSPGRQALDSAGSIYVLRYPYTVAKLDSAGNDVWSYTQAQPLRAVFTYGTGSGERVAVEYRGSPAALSFTTAGVPVGEITTNGDVFSRTPSGGMIATDGGRYVRVYDAAANQQQAFGDSHKDNDPSPAAAPLHFYQLGDATQLPDGRFLVTDTQRGVVLLSPTGMYLGAAPPSVISPLGLTQQSDIAVIGEYVYVAVGDRFTANQYVIRIQLADLLSRVVTTSASARLGLGAGVVDSSAGNYTPSGQAPDIRAVFDPWWSEFAPGLTLCWTLRSSDELHSASPGVVGSLAGTQWSYSPTGSPIPLPADLEPGAYILDASLVQSGVALTSTTLIMTIGAPGQRLSLPTLPPGAGWGGPAPARGLALTDELGTKTFREQLDWRQLLDNGPTAPLDFASYDDRLAAAGAEAARRGDTFIVQLGQGGPEKALVADGTWAARVHEVVAHFAGVVHVWEAWNEPNITFGASDYVTEVLAPVYQEVKAADPTAVVVGGSVVGVDVPYWRSLISAGGLDYLDVAAVHPYTGHNRSWEEQGTLDQLRELKPLLVRDGRPIPLWITELAWWSDGSANLFRQADASSRALLWMADLGIDKWAYFIPEGGWGNYGLTFSAIQVNDYVKPAALALMTTTSQLAGRSLLGEVSLGVPSAYALRFGPRADDPSSGELLVAWTDDVDLPFVLQPDQPGRAVTLTEELGASHEQTLSAPTPLTLTGSPTFLSLGGPGRLALTPAETFGVDVAAQSKGGSASASSSRAANPPDGAIDGDAGADGGGDLPGLPAWASAPGDATPTLTVDLGYAQTIDRVLIATHSIGSVVPGLRDYDVLVRADAGAPWTTVATVRSQFYERQRLISFPAQTVAAVRVVVRKLDYTGTNEDGSPPIYWVFDSPGIGAPAVISELQAFAPGATTAAKKAVSLTVSAPRTMPLVGSNMTVATTLSGLSGGVAGRRIELLRNGVVIAGGLSSATGTARLTAVVRGTASYTVRVAGDAAYSPATSGAFTVRASARTTSTLAVARSFSRSGGSAILVGKVAWSAGGQALAGAGVELWGYRSSWTRIAAKSSDYAGHVAFWLPKAGPRAYRLTFSGKSTSSAYALPSSTRSATVPIR